MSDSDESSFGEYVVAWRKRLGLKPGQKVLFIPLGNTLRLVVVPPIEEAQGMFPGIDTDVDREEADEER